MIPQPLQPRAPGEIGDPALRQLRYDEVLARAAEHGDLLAGLDAGRAAGNGPDKLSTYRAAATRRRPPNRYRPRHRPTVARATDSSFRNTTPDGCTTTSAWNATACWCPGRCQEPARHLGRESPGRAHRGPPAGVRHFEGTIPKGVQAGTVTVWDSGTYRAEKFGSQPNGAVR